MPLIVWTARKMALTGPVDDVTSPRPPPFSSSSSDWLTAAMCSRLSTRNRSAYWRLSTQAPARSAEHALYCLQHATRLEGFDDEILRACLNRFHHQRLLAHRAAHQDLRLRIDLADLADRIDAAHVGHDDVHRHEIRPKLAKLLDRFEPGLRLARDLESRLRQNVAHHGAHEDRVVTNENRLAHGASSRSAKPV